MLQLQLHVVVSLFDITVLSHLCMEDNMDAFHKYLKHVLQS